MNYYLSLSDGMVALAENNPWELVLVLIFALVLSLVWAFFVWAIKVLVVQFLPEQGCASPNQPAKQALRLPRHGTEVKRSGMKTYFYRVATIHACLVLALLALACIANYYIWAYTPDTRIETLETLLLPVLRPVGTLFTLALVSGIAFDPRTVRILRKLAYFR